MRLFWSLAAIRCSARSPRGLENPGAVTRLLFMEFIVTGVWLAGLRVSHLSKLLENRMTTKRNILTHREGRTFDEVVSELLSRRGVLKGALGASIASFLGGRSALRSAAAESTLLGFPSIPISKADTISLPPDYTWQVVNAWGDPIVAGGPEFKNNAAQSAADQAMQAGMHHDGMHYFPLPKGSNSSERGLLAVNFEYTDDGLLHKDGMENWSAEKVQKSKNAHGLGVMEIRFDGGSWKVVRDSLYGRRVTGDTPFLVKGPAAGHPLMQTALEPTGRTILGTLNNCAHGVTPWGTYLSCEENVAGYFIARSGKIPRQLARYGVDAKSWGYRWHEFDPRFDADLHPHEPNRHGWVVEIDPYDPSRPPVKHTALGRMAHENVALAMADDGRVVYYMGDDATFEHISSSSVRAHTYRAAASMLTRIFSTTARSMPRGSMPTAAAHGSSSRMERTAWRPMPALHPRPRS
jgi:secreted PhoX family phosphatase